MSRIARSITFSNVIALLALFIALGGSVYAASNKIDGSQIKAKSMPANRLQPGSVAAAQIKKGAIGQPQIEAGAVTAKQIGSGTITGTQIKAGSLGATQINQTTLTGVSAANIHSVQYVASTVTLVPGSKTGTSATATCPSGMKVIGGGATLGNKEFGEILESAPNAERNGWYVNGYVAKEPNISMTATAICTSVATTTG